MTGCAISLSNRESQCQSDGRMGFICCFRCSGELDEKLCCRSLSGVNCHRNVCFRWQSSTQVPVSDDNIDILAAYINASIGKVHLPVRLAPTPICATAVGVRKPLRDMRVVWSFYQMLPIVRHMKALPTRVILLDEWKNWHRFHLQQL